MSVTAARSGALVISLDFELHWGVRDHTRADGPYMRNVYGAREAVPAILDLFEEFEMAATWATVGFLFAESRSELERCSPTVRPAYDNRSLSPYGEVIGNGENDDPVHFAPSLIRRIQQTARQELATHTFSHYYCLEPGQDRQAFAADLSAAKTIAGPTGTRLRSIVFPRNQHNPAYDAVLREAGIDCYRGNPRSWMYNARGPAARSAPARIARLLDAYLPLAGSHTFGWEEVWQKNGLANVPASLFLHPTSPRRQAVDRLRLRRIVRALEYAAHSNRILHLWWHPHNFGRHTAENLAFLREILQAYSGLRDQVGLRSLSMREVADAAVHAP